MKRTIALLALMLAPALIPSLASAQQVYTRNEAGTTRLTADGQIANTVSVDRALRLLVSLGDVARAARLNLPLSTVAFGSVNATYSVFLNNASAVEITDLDVLNLTDQPITCSYDAGVNDHFVVPAYSSYSPDLGDTQQGFSGSLQCKRTGSAPTVGSVYVSAGY